MSAHPTENQTELRERLYAAYLKARRELPLDLKFVPYNWNPLPKSVSAQWLPYDQMLEEFARELANTINALINHVHRLRAWAIVIAPLSNEEKFEAAHEFIETLGAAAIGLPYVIKSRFAYAAAHLSHQANAAKSPTTWRDEFPAKDALYLNDVEPFGRDWKTFRAFKRRVEVIGGRAFNAATGDFRNAYNHRFPRRLVLGISGFVERQADGVGGRIRYAIGGQPPLHPSEVADLLERECVLSDAAFRAFQALVQEHADAIAAVEVCHEDRLP